MDIFVFNIPYNETERSLKKFFTPIVRGINQQTVFAVVKLGRKPCAILTVRDERIGKSLLNKYGLGYSSTYERLWLGGRVLGIKLSSRAADPLMLRTLEKEAIDRASHQDIPRLSSLRLANTDKRLGFKALSFGQWGYQGAEICYHVQETIEKSGTLHFAKEKMILKASAAPSHVQQDPSAASDHIEIAYYSIQSMSWNSVGNPCIAISLSEAPRIYRRVQPTTLIGSYLTTESNPIIWNRVSSLSETSKTSSGSCLVYQIQLDNHTVRSTLNRILQNNPQIPQLIPLPIRSSQGRSFSSEMDILDLWLRLNKRDFGFKVRFQIERLAKNGYLTPGQVIAILPDIKQILPIVQEDVCAEALQRLSRRIPFSGPEQAPSEFEPRRLIELLRESISSSQRENIHSDDTMKRHDNIKLIHRLMVTPSGEYLEGPEQETINRVLRQYRNFTDHFLRVVFCDDDFGPLRFSKGVSLKTITHGRFKAIMDDGVTVGGRKFEFLGFSHSSLKTQSAWFMSPILNGKQKIVAREVIQGLGDFSEFRCPAKCAARIGQAFTDTSSSIRVSSSSIQMIPDIKRNDRCFSDGVGTISQKLLERLWHSQPSSGSAKPSLYQIRIAGAKGMIALDPTLQGEILRLRPSMIKFKSSAKDLEVCGAGTRALPMYLNRQYIKIFEDLGVARQSFLDLQHDAVERLRRVTTNPINAAVFIDGEKVCQAAGTPSLIRRLYYESFDFREDRFLTGVVEIATLARLREIKYRGRLPVENGVMLYGIMDETATLSEGEIYCSADGRIITGRVLVTRSPALHPGDAQMATAINVPNDSALKCLDNCIVFSQKGHRDLPSQLSGGDLDGDMFCVIWDKRLLPLRTVKAADYARTQARELQRSVTVKDMTDFFVDFLENDQLGVIATRHVQVADMLGTEHPDCLTLAEMHSTAVDFSKTGIPVDIKQLPKCSPAKPDFMAPSPRAIIENCTAKLSPEEMLNGIGSDESDSELLDRSSRKPRYYESTRVLGELYRQIDETDFLNRVHSNYRIINERHKAEPSMMSRFWSHVQRENLDVEWEHLKEWAADVKDLYESQMLDTLDQFSWGPSKNMTELEVFVGTVLGREGAMISRRMRDMSADMKEKFSHDVATAMNSMKKGSDGEDLAQHGALPRAMACLAVAMETNHFKKLRRFIQPLQSFKYVAASVCLTEMHRREPEEIVWTGRTRRDAPTFKRRTD